MNKKKHGYTPSKSEFIMLSVLLFAVVIALAVNYLLAPAWENMNLARQENEIQQGILESLKADFALIDSYRDQDASLNEQVAALKAAIPDFYSQEEVITNLNLASEKSGLELSSMSFAGVQQQGKNAFLANLSGIPAPATTENQAGILSESVTLGFSGNYQSFISFLSQIEGQERKYYFRSLVLARSESGGLSGSIDMLAFSRTDPLKEAGYPGYDWPAPQAAGKADPFETYDGYLDPEAVIEPSSLTNPDFFVILNTYDDDANKIVMGKYPLSNTQLSSDLNGEAKASITLSAESGVWSYRYELDGVSYSGTMEAAAGNSIYLRVLSRDRKSGQDKVGLTLDVKNSTDRKLIINVLNDDPDDPRFTLGQVSGQVEVER